MSAVLVHGRYPSDAEARERLAELGGEIVADAEERRLRRKVRETRAIFEQWPDHGSEIDYVLAKRDLDEHLRTRRAGGLYRSPSNGETGAPGAPSRAVPAGSPSTEEERCN